MENLLTHFPDPTNLVAWVVFLGANLGFIKYQMKTLISDNQKLKEQFQQANTDIAVIKEQINQTNKKLDNGLSSEVKNTSLAIARIETKIEDLNCVKESRCQKT